ncbi:MAG TPA: hypothetical protein VIO83_02255, partial [Pseudomonas sp.]
MAVVRTTPKNILLIFRSQLRAIHQARIIARESSNSIIGIDLNDEPRLLPEQLNTPRKSAPYSVKLDSEQLAPPPCLPLENRSCYCKFPFFVSCSDVPLPIQKNEPEIYCPNGLASNTIKTSSCYRKGIKRPVSSHKVVQHGSASSPLLHRR